MEKSKKKTTVKKLKKKVVKSIKKAITNIGEPIAKAKGLI